MNHIATGRALSLGGELLPPHHGSQQQGWRWRWNRWRWLRGQFPVPAACRNRDSVPRNLSSMAAALRNPWRNMTGVFRVFASGGYIGRRGDVGGASWAPNHMAARPEGGPRHLRVWAPRGPSSSLLRTPWWCWKNRDFAFCFVQFREYSQKYFSETKNSRKQGTGTVASY